MISHTATMTSQISESEKEDRSSMEIVIIESPLSLCGMRKSRRASFNNPFTSVIHRKMKKPHLKIMKMRGTCNLCWIDYTVGEGLFRLPVMRYLLLEKRWTDKD